MGEHRAHPRADRLIRWGGIALLIGLAGFVGWALLAPSPKAVPPAPPTPVVALPISMDLPALGITGSPLAEVAKQPDGTIAVPPVTNPGQLAWYRPGVRPGAVGPAIVLGHVSGRPAGAKASVPGVFARLGQLELGARITVHRQDGSSVTFEAYKVASYAKASFPTPLVYGNTRGPELRLITCGGVFDPRAHSYESNVVVYARAV